MDSKTMALIRDSIRGVAEVYDTQLGLAISRLPAWTKSHHEHDALTGIVAGQASGVRILIETSATEITLIYRATLDKSIMNGFSSHSTASLTCDGFEASVSHSNGNSRIWNGPSNPKFEEGEDSVAVFKLPPSDNSRLVSIWLPHNCEIQIVDLAANAPMTPGTPPAVRWLHYGSSISHSGEAENPLGVWPTRVAIDEGFDLYSLGLAGSCNLEYFAARTIAAWPADLITLKLGINVVNGATMTERTFIPAVHGLLDTIRMVQPKVRIVVISPIYCEGHETNPGPTTPGIDGKATGAEPNANEWVKELTLVRAREILADIATKRADSNLEYLDGLKLFSASDAHLMPDGLHPNAQGYLLIAERFKRLVF
jgi:lysophospholipase L1-like esterase